VRQDHVVQALIGGARHFRVFAHDLQVFLEGAFPVDLSIVAEIELFADDIQNVLSGCGHGANLPCVDAVFGIGYRLNASCDDKDRRKKG
jgi:hypothetical protein